MTSIKESKKSFFPYEPIKRIAKGGMGEIFLVYDPICQRNIALKKINPELSKNKIIRKRFLKEASITAQLTHPSILPIYTIHVNETSVYYTMPYIEGRTLKTLLQKAKKQNQQGLFVTDEASIPSLIRIFINICEAMAYAHANNILHRDLKPENVMVGKYGEVIILDWGIAHQMYKKEDTAEIETSSNQLTMPGKLAGTLTFLAPERAKGESASILTDIYALGVILYQILTFSVPFQRPNISEFRKYIDREVLINPIERAPYRDIPHHLSQICMKCLAKEKKNRYTSIEELIQDLQDFISGKPDWIHICDLNTQTKNDWKFQENFLLTKHIAITRQTDIASWYNIMISNSSFSANIKIEADISFNKNSAGIGFLLSIPNLKKKKTLDEGYCLWIGSEKTPVIHFYRNHVLVKEVLNFILQQKQTHHVTIEKYDHFIRFFLDGNLYLTYQSYLPLSGTHVGLISKDDEYKISNFKVYSGSYSVMVSCLAVADAFFAKKDFDIALEEYRNISTSFPGRSEGREALFRCGITLLEKAKNTKDKSLYQKALDEFAKLNKTPGAPLEYLGKAYVYEALKENIEEAKCLELALRKFPKHPLLFILREHIIHRCHASSHKNREDTYRLLIIGLRFLPSFLENIDTQKLLLSLQVHWENLYFMEKPKDPKTIDKDHIIIELAYRLGRKKILEEMLKEHLCKKNIDSKAFCNCLFALLEMQEIKLVKKTISDIFKKKDKYIKSLKWIELASLIHENTDLALKKLIKQIPKKLFFKQKRTILYMIQIAIDKNEITLLDKVFKKLDSYRFGKEFQLKIDSFKIWFYILKNKKEKAKTIFLLYPKNFIHDTASSLYWLYGMWLLSNNKEQNMLKHFSSHILDTKNPRTGSLLSRVLLKKISKKQQDKLFFWEKRELFRQLSFYYYLQKDEKKASGCRKKYV